MRQLIAGVAVATVFFSIVDAVMSRGVPAIGGEAFLVIGVVFAVEMIKFMEE